MGSAGRIKYWKDLKGFGSDDLGQSIRAQYVISAVHGVIFVVDSSIFLSSLLRN